MVGSRCCTRPRQVYDPAAPSGSHSRNYRTAAEVSPQEIHLDSIYPGLHVVILQRANGPDNTGIVDQYVNPSKPLHRPPSHAFHRALVGHIRFDYAGLCTHGPGLFRGLFQLPHTPCRQGQLRAFIGIGQRNGPANPSPGAGDQGNFVLEPHKLQSSLSGTQCRVPQVVFAELIHRCLTNLWPTDLQGILPEHLGQAGQSLRRT